MKKLTKRTLTVLLLVIILIFTVAAVGACAKESGSATNGTELSLTLEELAQYDGLEGRKAYIAVDGIIYDVTDISQWKDGLHQERFQAGQDYSEEIRNDSPHGTKMLDRAPKVGVLVD
ncbi:MAG: hypothetical protein GX825_06055 [Syntrophomonadaceae bacterium]|nr:hypothetical protein [Syntrophomonadaceae bacterium]